MGMCSLFLAFVPAWLLGEMFSWNPTTLLWPLKGAPKHPDA